MTFEFFLGLYNSLLVTLALFSSLLLHKISCALNWRRSSGFSYRAHGCLGLRLLAYQLLSPFWPPLSYFTSFILLKSKTLLKPLLWLQRSLRIWALSRKMNGSWSARCCLQYPCGFVGESNFPILLMHAKYEWLPDISCFY